ncbi:MAG: hypothetical protein AB8B52_02410 [Winogradskyella sp.]|uniref:hypothetical protein n=1 Tax=Winogradskyella sp. TaxID=1883156 RepID=UPI00385FE35C
MYKSRFQNDNEENNKYKQNLKPLKKDKTDIINQSEGQDSVNESNTSIDQIYDRSLNKDWGFFERMGNKRMFDVVEGIKTELVQVSADYKLSFYKTLLDARLEGLHEKCDAGVKMIKGYYRQQVGSFLMQKMAETSDEVCSRQLGFIEMIKTKYDEASKLDNYPSIKKNYLASISREEERHFRFLDSIILRFENIVDSELEKFN